MTKNEKLLIALAAFDSQLKAAKEALEEHFRVPVKAWLKTLKYREHEVDGVVKAYIRPLDGQEPYDAPDAAKIETAFTASVDNGRFSKADLLDLIAKGLLTPVPNQDLAGFLVRNGIGKAKDYITEVPAVEAGWTDELRLHALAKGKFEGLKANLKKTVDLEAVIIKTAEAIESVPLEILEPAQGQVALKSSKK